MKLVANGLSYYSTRWACRDCKCRVIFWRDIRGSVNYRCGCDDLEDSILRKIGLGDEE